MLQYPPQEVLAPEGAVLSGSGIGIDVSERHPPIVVGDNVLFADNAPVQIAGQVFQGWLATADTGAMDDPFCGDRPGQCQAGLVDSGQHPGAED